MEKKATFSPREASQLRPPGWPFCPFVISSCIFSGWVNWLSILSMLYQSRRKRKSKEQNNGKERTVNKCLYNPCESKLTQTFQTEFSVCLNLSQNFQFNLHIDFTSLLFRSKDIIYLCQKRKKKKYQDTLGKRRNTPLLQDSGGSYAELAATTLPVLVVQCLYQEKDPLQDLFAPQHEITG